MKYDEFKERCHKAWGERFKDLCIDMTRNEDEGKIVLSMKAKPYILKVSPKLNFKKKNDHNHILLNDVSN